MSRSRGSRRWRAGVALPLLGVLVGVDTLTAAGTSAAPAVITSPIQDPERDCLEAIPESASVAQVTDAGQTISLEVLVLMDGISASRAREVLDTMAESYAPLSIEAAPRFRKVRLSHDGVEAVTPGGPPEETGDALRLIREAKALLGGTRPQGVDVVLILTSKNIFYDDGQRQYGLAGLADCIGGVRYPEHAFAVSEGESPWEETVGDQLLSGKIAAHEVGHLMGAHHHYANCGQGDRHPEGSDSYCTVMFPAQIRFMARNFGTIEAVVVRGHAVDFASP